VPAALTDSIARDLYGLEADEVMDTPVPTPLPEGVVVAAA
jgi:hypothetical protein